MKSYHTAFVATWRAASRLIHTASHLGLQGLRSDVARRVALGLSGLCSDVAHRIFRV